MRTEVAVEDSFAAGMNSTRKKESPSRYARLSAWLGQASRKMFFTWLFLTAIWIIVGTLTVCQQVMSQDIDWKTALQFALLDWGPWVLLSPFVVMFASRFPIDGRNWLRMVPVYVVIGMATVALHQGVNEYAHAHHWIEPPRFRRMPPPPPEASAERKNEGFLIQFVRLRFSAPIFVVLVAASHALTYHRRSLERERRALEAEARLTEARLSALQTQMQPHFLFNTLNAISSLIYSNPPAADEMLCQLSALLRRVLEFSERSEVTLSQELEFVDAYLSIQRLRFPDRLSVKHEIEPGLEHLMVPTLILQALVENAIVHGIAPNARGGEVCISASVDGDRCLLEVSNTGERVPARLVADDGRLKVSERVGLRNTRVRLAAIHGDRQSFDLYALPTGGVSARISMPWTTESIRGPRG